MVEANNWIDIVQTKVITSCVSNYALKGSPECKPLKSLMNPKYDKQRFLGSTHHLGNPIRPNGIFSMNLPQPEHWDMSEEYADERNFDLAFESLRMER